MSKKISIKLLSIITKSGRHGVPLVRIFESFSVNKKAKSRKPIMSEIISLIDKGEIFELERRYYSCEVGQKGTVTRINVGFGFVTTENQEEIFVPGKYLMGAMPDDTVLVIINKFSKGNLKDGKVAKILSYGGSTLTGTLTKENGINFVIPDNMRFPLRVNSSDLGDAKIGDKVYCQIVKRGESHSLHRVSIIKSCGSSIIAKNCADALLLGNGISLNFPAEVMAEAVSLQQEIDQRDTNNRLDLRNDIIFTIDGADTKDIDDAISISKKDDIYTLGVHIADVSHYVKIDSQIEKEAFKRGTSIYFADRVIPMLPKELSNGICSLNPNVDRLAFSCIMKISKDGELLDYSFKKSVICSKVKGVYTEVNKILDGTETAEIKQKYNGMYDSIFLMKELADILTKNKLMRGSPEIETVESKIMLDQNGKACDVVARTRGSSEVIIEEFMLMANQSAANYAKKMQVPFVYRVHEPPTVEKVENLRNSLAVIGVPTNDVSPSMKTKVLQQLIWDSKESSVGVLVNNLCLRAMSKAKYFEVPLGHYGLVLEDYAQFTSPIRRYPDLTIHRVLSKMCQGVTADKIQRMKDFVVSSARQSTKTELNAMNMERKCEDFYKAEYMQKFIGDEFEGIITAVTSNGFYVMLDNSVEGLVKADSLPGFESDGAFKYISPNKTYTIGDKVKVKCIGSNVALGNVDFKINIDFI